MNMSDILLDCVEPVSTRGDACCEQTAPEFSIAENQCRVLTNEWANAEYKHLVLAAPTVALAARPGQFFHLACPSQGEEVAFLRRPMSVYRVAADIGQIEFLYKVQGIGTRGLASLETGDVLDALGPLGQGFDLPPACAHALILARGVGLATLAPLAEFAIAQGAAVTAILSARSPELVMSAEYLREVGAKVVTVTDVEQNSDVENLERLIRKLHAESPFDYLTTCGSNRQLLLLQRLGAELQVRGEVALEQRMGCGLGMCFACVRPFRCAPSSDQSTYRRVCWDGPVFDLQETLSW